MNTDLSTTGLFKMLDDSKTLDQAIDGIEQSINLTVILRELIEQSGLGIKEFSEQLMASRIFVYQMLEGTRKPGRDMLLRMALVSNLTLEEAQHLLKIAQKSMLYPRVRRDAVIIFALQRSYTLVKTDVALHHAGEQPLLAE